MKLLFFASDYEIGLSTLLTQQAMAYNAEGIDLVCVAGEMEQEQGLSLQMEESSVRLIRMNGLDKHARFFHLTKEIESIINEHNIACVHVQNNWQLTLITYLKMLKRIPGKTKVIYTLHGFRHNYIVWSTIATILIGLALLLFADKTFIMSNPVKKKFRLISYKTSKLYLGVDTSFFKKQTNEIDTSHIRMIFPAQFRYGKNQNLLIRAVARYVKQTSDESIQLYLPGSGDSHRINKAKQLAKQLGVEKCIMFSGFCSRKEILELYEKCNIGVIPSNFETFGQCIVEPYVLGKCIVSRNVGVAADIIEKGKNGFLFHSEDDLLNILLKFSENKAIIKEIGDINFSNRDVFRWSNIAKKYAQELNTL